MFQATVVSCCSRLSTRSCLSLQGGRRHLVQLQPVSCYRNAASLFRSFSSTTSLLSKPTVSSDGGISVSLADIIGSADESNKKKDPLKHRLRLDVAIVGLPNAGKSQLLNVLTQSTVSAVSRKRHTTRQGLLGARTIIDRKSRIGTQLLFVDTPGFLKVHEAKKEGLERDLVVTATQEMQAVDYTIVVVDGAKNLTGSVKETITVLMLQALQSSGRSEFQGMGEEEEDSSSSSSSESEDEGEGKSKGEINGVGKSEGKGDVEELETSSDDDSDIDIEKFCIVINKVDLVKPKDLLVNVAMELGLIADNCIKHIWKNAPVKAFPTLVDDDGNVVQFDQDEELDDEVFDMMRPTIFYVSALEDDGVDDVLQHLLDKATPTKQWELQAGESTNLTPEQRVEEIIREKIYRCLHKELPYGIQQKNVLFQAVTDQTTGKLGLLVHQELLVRTTSQKDIVMGKGGMTLERIRETAERDLIKIFGFKVVLQLFIKVMKRRKRKWAI